jgi:hypothetical protein
MEKLLNEREDETCLPDYGSKGHLSAAEGRTYQFAVPSGKETEDCDKPFYRRPTQD